MERVHKDVVLSLENDPIVMYKLFILYSPRFQGVSDYITNFILESTVLFTKFKFF